MRLGAVPYLNSLPLIHGLPWEVRKASPAALDRLLKIGELDLATAPIVTLFENPSYSLVPEIAIGCRGPVKSVRLVFQKEGMTLGDVRNIYLDMESRTSAMLLKILFHFKHNINLEKIRFDHPLPGPDPDAVLLIGNKAMIPAGTGPVSSPSPGSAAALARDPLSTSHPSQEKQLSLDLGEEWTTWTGLPFVFAAWIGHVPQLPKEVIETLVTTCQKNLFSIDDLVTYQTNFPKDEARSYLLDNVSYHLGDEEIEGLKRFHSYAKELDLIHHELRLNFYPR